MWLPKRPPHTSVFRRAPRRQCSRLHMSAAARGRASLPLQSAFDLLVADACFRFERSMLARTIKDRLLKPRKGGVAARLFVAALIVAVGFAQFSASWHEASVRHVQCAEHGEAIEIGIVSDLGPSPTRHRAASTGMEGADNTETTSHDHCSLVLAFRASARDQVLRQFTRFVPPTVVVRPASEPARRPGRTFVLASAPKTSPPTA
jgi:hypothetical protein